MVIEETDFKLEIADDNLTYDLSLLYVINAKDIEKRREEFKTTDYNLQLETCLRKIINYRLSKRIDVTSFAEYVEEFKDERKKLEDLASLK